MKKIRYIISAVMTAAIVFGGCSIFAENEKSNIDNSAVSSAPSSVSDDTSESTSTPTESKSESSLAESSLSSSDESSKASQSSESSEKSNVQESSRPALPAEISTEPSKIEEPEPIDTSVLYDYESKYFVSKLPEHLLREFIKMYKGAMGFKSSVNFSSSISEDDLEMLMYLLNYDCPELIHVSGDYYPHYINDENYVSSVGLSFCMSEKDYKKSKAELDKFFSELKDKLAFNSDIEKEKYVYDYIFDNCIYDESDILSGSVYGTLIRHKGRCEGFSKSFMWCMREVGVECMTVSGEQNWDNTALYPNHSWNIVKINGEYYNLDVTVDDIRMTEVVKTPANYGFYNVSDNYIKDNRKAEPLYKELGLPECNTMIENYHQKRDLFIYYDDFYRINLFKILSDNFDDKTLKPVSIKFYNSVDYEEAARSINDYVSEFLNDNSEKTFIYNTYCSDLSNTIVIEAELEKPEESEEE